MSMHETESVPAESQEDPRFAELEQKIESSNAVLLGSIKELTRSIGEGMTAMDEKVNLALELAQSPQTGPSPAPTAPPDEVAQRVEEGIIRFFSPYKNYTYVWKPGHNYVDPTSGTMHRVHEQKVAFVNGILDLHVTRDAEIITALREGRDPDTKHPYLGSDYFEDPTAVPLPGPTIVEGPRGTSSARPERPAPLAVRAN